ncbi:MAG: helix-turn-helix transcriptional regulator [Candidatus Gracilibacteria bacterium]|nr:helix-turn-helix transcriptional regulator [Candidatus Gracilibacteria bacterium]
MPANKSLSENWIGERIRELRRIKGISQEALAIKAGIPMVSLAKVEQGKIQKPAFQMVWKIVVALEITLDEFVEGQESENISK